MLSEDDTDIVKTRAFNICRQFLTGDWQTITLDELCFSGVSGGLSNRLFHCSLPEDKKVKGTKSSKVPNEVLLRLYGPVQDEVAVVVREATIFMLLSERNMGPKLYGIFPEGRLEQYIPSRSISAMDVRRHSLVIAREMAKVHALEVPIDKRPDTLLKLLHSWQEFIDEKADKMAFKSEVHEIMKHKLKREWQWLNELIEQGDWPVVFCHNDLHGGNILYREDVKPKSEEASLLLIDFEFSSYNYRGFDIGNHLCEWCFDYNTKEFPYFIEDRTKFPDRKDQMAFFEAYLEELTRQGQEIDMEEEKLKMLHEVMLFRMASHLIWSTWSFKMSLHSSINFAFSEYGVTRWNVYLKCKEEYVNNVPLQTTNHTNNGNLDVGTS